MTSSLLSNLHQLVCLYNVQTAYYDVTRRRRQATPDSLLAVLKALGAPVQSLNDIPSALREIKQAQWRRVMEPVTVFWEGKLPVIRVCLPASLAGKPVAGHLELESGDRMSFRWASDDLDTVESATIEGKDYVVESVTLPEVLPLGYHSFFLEIGGNCANTLIIAAPEKACLPTEGSGSRRWGVFAPLYALQSQNKPGGDYADLGSLADWVSSLGGQTVATLPLLPSFLDEPFQPSPYAPVSRLLWNEFYIDLESVPEVKECPRVMDLMNSSSLQREIRELRGLPLVDYRRVMSLKRRVLEECCRHLISENSGRFREFQGFIRDNPVVADYALFRAAMEKQGSSWLAWPERMRRGTLDERNYEEGCRLYHTYAQWLAHRQVAELAAGARRRGVTLYFDLPLGTHPEGYDTWRHHECFALEATAGAPPDAVFTWGQDWLFPPLHPERIREQGYRYFRDYLSHHLRQAGMLRIDHIMGLHRLFWIPKGIEASRGVYVRYHAEELYAVLALESRCHRSIIIGEDLGTVPSYVRPAMSQHGFQRMYVLHYELADNSRLHNPQGNVVASLNTHDMPPFASFWQGLDIEERQSLRLLNDKGARDGKRARRATLNALTAFLSKKKWLSGKGVDVRAALRACLAFLSASRAWLILANLEDLWLETQSQNVPSTDDRNPNWRRKARYTLEEFCRMPEVRDTLKEIDSIRKRVVK